MRRVAVNRFSIASPEIRCQKLLSEGAPTMNSKKVLESPCTIFITASSVGAANSDILSLPKQQTAQGNNVVICNGGLSSYSSVTIASKREYSTQAAAMNRTRGYGTVGKNNLREKKKKFNYITQERLIRAPTCNTEYGRSTKFFRENNESTRLYTRSRKEFEEMVVKRAALLPPDIARRIFFEYVNTSTHWFKTTNVLYRPRRANRYITLPDDLYLKTVHGLIYRYSKQPQVKVALQQLMKLYDIGRGLVDEGVSIESSNGMDYNGLPCSPLVVNHRTDLQKHLFRDDGFNVMLSRFQEAVVAFDRQEVYENNGGKKLGKKKAIQSVEDGFSMETVAQGVYCSLTGTSALLVGQELEVLCAAFACSIVFRHHPSLPEYSSLLPEEHAAYNALKAKRSKESHDKLLPNGKIYLQSDKYVVEKDFNELCEYLAVVPFARGSGLVSSLNNARSSFFLKNVLRCESLPEYQPQTTFFRQLSLEMSSTERKNIIKYVCHHRLRLTAAISAENRALASLRNTFLTINECRLLIRDGRWMMLKALRERASGLADSSLLPLMNIESKNRLFLPNLMPSNGTGLLTLQRTRQIKRYRDLILSGKSTPAQEMSYDRHLLTTFNDLTVLQRASLTFPFCARIAIGEGCRTYRNPFSTFLAYRCRQLAELYGRKIPCMSVFVLGIAKEWFALSQEEKNKFDVRMISSQKMPLQFPLVNTRVTEDNQNFDEDVFNSDNSLVGENKGSVKHNDTVMASITGNNNKEQSHLTVIPPMPSEGEDRSQWSMRLRVFQKHRAAALKTQTRRINKRGSKGQNRSHGIYHEEFESTLEKQLHVAKRFRITVAVAIANEIACPGNEQKKIMDSRVKKTYLDGCHMSVLENEVMASLAPRLDAAILTFLKTNVTWRYHDRSLIVPSYLLASVAMGRHHHPPVDKEVPSPDLQFKSNPKKLSAFTQKLGNVLNFISSTSEQYRKKAIALCKRMISAEVVLQEQADKEAREVHEEKRYISQEERTQKMFDVKNEVVVTPYQPPSEYIIHTMAELLTNMDKLEMSIRNNLRIHRMMTVLCDSVTVTTVAADFNELFTGKTNLPPVPAVLCVNSAKYNKFISRFCDYGILSQAAESKDSLVYVGPVQSALELPKNIIDEGILNKDNANKERTSKNTKKVTDKKAASKTPPINRYPIALEFNLSDEAGNKRAGLEPYIERDREMRLIGEIKQRALDRQVEDFAALRVPGGGKTISEVMLAQGVDVVAMTKDLQKKVMDRFYNERKQRVDIRRAYNENVRPLTSSDDQYV